MPMLDETPLSSCTPEQQVHLGLAQVYVSVFVISSHVAHDNPIACLEATLHFDEVTGALPNIHFDLRRAPPSASSTNRVHSVFGPHAHSEGFSM